MFPQDRYTRPPYTTAEILALIDTRTQRKPAEPTKIVLETINYGDITVRGGGATDRDSITGDVNKIKIDTTSGTSTTYGSIGGAVDGTNKIFINEAGKYKPGTTEVYWGTQKQTLAVDYTESDATTGEITFTVAPVAATNITWAYVLEDDSPIIVFMTTETGTDIPTFTTTVAGGVTSFTLVPYISATLRVYLNGALQVQLSLIHI